MKSSRSRPSKRAQILSRLSDQLATGSYKAGDRLPTEPELARQFGVSTATIREAVSALVHQGLLRRVQGSGTYVEDTAAPASTVPHCCALFMQANGDLYLERSRVLMQQLQKRGIIPMVFDSSNYGGPQGDAARLRDLRNVMAHGVNTIVAEQSIDWIVEEYRRQGIAQRPQLAVIGNLWSKTQPDVAVVTDYAYGLHLATRHLVSLGHQRPLLVIHDQPERAADEVPHELPGPYGDMLRSYMAALPDQEDARYLLLKHELTANHEVTRLKALLQGPDRATAIVCFGDYRARVVIDIARRCGLHTPRDLAVTGYFNTPWAEHPPVPLTSVDIDPAGMARELIRRLYDSPSTTPHLSLPPKLVVRASCGASLLAQSATEIP